MQSKTRQKPGLFLLLAGWTLTSLLAACSPPSQPVEKPAQLPLQDQVIKVACPKETIATLLSRYAPIWARKVGARVEPVPYKNPADLPALEGISAWIIRPAEMPRWAAAGSLSPVPAEYRAAGGVYGWSGLLALYREKLLKWADETYGLPLVGEAPLCFYRAELLADVKHQTAFREKYKHQLLPPRTWDEFADIAEYFYSNRKPGTVVPSLPSLPGSAEQLDYLFHAIAAPHVRRAVYQDQDEDRRIADDELFSYHYDLKTGEPRIHQPGFVCALQLLQKLQRFLPAEASAEPAQDFADSRAVLCLAEASWIARFRAKLPPAHIGVCEVPGSTRWFGFRDGTEHLAVSPDGNRIPYQGAGGWIAVVPRTAPNAQAAFALFAELGGPATSRQIVFEPAWGGGAFREEHLNLEQNWFSFELDRAMTLQLRQSLQQTLARPGLKSAAVRLRIPDERAHRDALVDQVRRALTTQSDATEALRNVANRWKELDAATDEKTRKNNYLLSLGLSRVH